MKSIILNVMGVIASGKKKRNMNITKEIGEKRVSFVKKNREKLKCTHGKPKERCVDCSESQMCIHMSRKSECKECGGSEICIHKKRKIRCV